MSYMGPRFVSGGGQIYPQGGGGGGGGQSNAPFQSQQQLRQYQVMQMQMQLQQKIQMQKQQLNAKNPGPDNSMNKGKPNQVSNQGPNQGSNQNQSNAGINRPNSNPRQQNNVSNSKPNPNQPNQRNVNPPQSQNQKDKPQNNGPQTNSKPNSTNPPNNDNRNQPNVNNQNKDNKPDPSNLKGPKKPRFGGNSPGVQPPPHQQPQQKVPLMGNAPGAPPQKPEIKSEQLSPHKGRPNQGGYNNMNQHNSYDQDKRNSQQNAGGNRNFGGRGPPNSNQGQPQTQENSFSRPQRNMNANMNDYQSHRRGGGGVSSNYKGSRNYYGQDKVKEKALQTFTTPMTELSPLDITEKKFNAYARLFIGNIPKNCEQKEVVALFEKYGEIGSVYLNKDSSFAFINFDYKANAAKAMRELDNTMIKNRYLKVRFATINEGIRVKNLSPYVSNELLEKAFSIFGVVESCRVLVDDRGNPKREGIIIFRDKKAGVFAVKKCQEECFFLSGALRPVVVTPLEPSEDNVEGYPETSIPKNEEFHTERQIPPHFADNGSFEFEFGVQWKELFRMYDEKKSVLDRDFQIELERLEKKMVLAKVEYETDKLRKELAQREAESAQLRRHFEFATDGMAGSSLGPSSGSGGPNYDSYSGAKRPLEQGYDNSYSGQYDPQYNDNYDRGGYPQGEYDRGYGSYGREEYRREGGYNQEDPYERPHFDHPAEGAPERTMFEAPAEPGYASNPQETPLASEPYKAPNKRPRY